MLAASLLLSGTQGLLLYRDLLTRKDLPRLTPSPERNANLIGILLNLGVEPTAAYWALAVLVVCMAVVAVRRAPVWKLFAIGTSGSLLVVPHTYAYDATLLLLPLWCGMFLSSRWLTRVVSATLCLPILFFLMILEPPYAAALGIAILTFFLVCSVDPSPEAPSAAKVRLTAAEAECGEPWRHGV